MDRLYQYLSEWPSVESLNIDRTETFDNINFPRNLQQNLLHKWRNSPVLTIVSGSFCDAAHLVQGILFQQIISVRLNNTDQYVCLVIYIRFLVVAFIGRTQCRCSIELKMDVK